MAAGWGEDEQGTTCSHTTTRAEGDLGIGADPGALADRHRAVADHPWVWLRQVHGAEVVAVTADNAAAVTGTEGDALVTAEPDLVLSVQTADCVPVTFASPVGVIGVAHAGWRGLEAGVIGATVAAMRDLGATEVIAAIGPHIGGECYEFGPADLDRLADGFGPPARATTSWGTAGLDLRWLVQVALFRAGVGPAPDPAAPESRLECTACDAERWFSHRARAEPERMATAIWRERASVPATGPR